MPQSQMSTEERISASARNGDAPKPPWGDEENFDAERAWTLIQNLRSEKEDLRARHAAELEEKVRELDTANKDLATAREDLEAAQKDVETRDSEISALKSDLGARESVITKQRLLNEEKIPLEYVENVTGDDEEAWKASVKRLSSLAASSGAQRSPDPVQAARNAGGSPAPSKDEEARSFFGV